MAGFALLLNYAFFARPDRTEAVPDGGVRKIWVTYMGGKK